MQFDSPENAKQKSITFPGATTRMPSFNPLGIQHGVNLTSSTLINDRSTNERIRILEMNQVSLKEIIEEKDSIIRIKENEIYEQNCEFINQSSEYR